MKAKLEIKMDNAAFEEAPSNELARILRELAGKLERNGLDDFPLSDVNGNRVGWLNVYLG